MERRLAAILAADVVGYTRLMGWDEAGTLHRLTALREQIVQPLIARHRGRVVKLMGDGLLVEFSSVVDAIACAAAWQERVIEHEAEGDVAKQVRFRIGINVGDVIVEGDDIHGDGVNIAARLEGLADPGGIFLSEDAYRQARGKTEVEFQDLGERALKNVSEPVRVYRVATSVSGAVSAKLASGPRSLPDKPSIAVLPFTNMSGDPEQEYFSDGITEDIITGLAKVSGLFIIARNSVFTYKGKAVKIQQVSQELGVRYVLEGSVRKAGNRVRITAQLIDGDTGGHIWAERYDRDLSDVFHIQDEISQSIVEAAKVATAPKERSDIQKTPTTNMEAYQFYLRGRQFLHEMTRKNLELARQMFLKAIELDGDYVHAYAGLADCGSVLCLFYDDDPETLKDTLSHSRKALQLDPDLAEAHVSHGLALWLTGDDAAAKSEFETAIRIDPTLYEGYWFLGRIYMNRGDFERSAEMFERASDVRGDDLQSMMMITTTYDGLGLRAKAKASAERAYRSAERRLRHNPDDARAAYVGAMSLVFLGDSARALEWADLAAAIESDDARTTYNLACVYARLGATDKALEYLDLSVKSGRCRRQIKWVEIDPDLAAVRDEPRFKQIIEEWGGSEKR